MSKGKDVAGASVDLVAIQPSKELIVSPPTGGVIGRFLDETQNMFKARAMRMNGLLRRINEAGQRAESLLRMAAESMEAAEARLEHDLRKEGLVPQVTTDPDE